MIMLIAFGKVDSRNIPCVVSLAFKSSVNMFYLILIKEVALINRVIIVNTIKLISTCELSVGMMYFIKFVVYT